MVTEAIVIWSAEMCFLLILCSFLLCFACFFCFVLFVFIFFIYVITTGMSMQADQNF